MKILNLTQHQATLEQIQAGVVDVENTRTIKKLLTFDSLPSSQELEKRAMDLARFVKGQSLSYEFVMIGGAPFFMAPLERALKQAGYTPVYAFSMRESVEKIIDGKTVKTAVFLHKGFVGL